jgi:hypothetical protein
MIDDMEASKLMEGNWTYWQFCCTIIGILETGVAGVGGGRVGGGGKGGKRKVVVVVVVVVGGGGGGGGEEEEEGVR